MVAAPQNATVTFIGQSGKQYNIDAYISDVVGAALTWSPNGAAGTASLPYWRAPEGVVLVDFSVVTGLTDTKTAIFQQDGATLAGSSLRWANMLNTLNSRAPPRVPFPAGALIGAIQA